MTETGNMSLLSLTRLYRCWKIKSSVQILLMNDNRKRDRILNFELKWVIHIMMIERERNLIWIPICKMDI